MAKASLKLDSRHLHANVKKFPEELRRNVAAVVDYRAAYTQGYLRATAKWTDRTGAARSGLFAIPLSYGNTYEIFMAYSVNYGIWLEVANNRKYAVITPAVRIIGNMLMRDLENLIERMT